MYIPPIKVKVPLGHYLSKLFMKNGTANNKTIEWGKESAEQLVLILWYFIIVLSVVLTHSAWKAFLMISLCDIIFRYWKIKSQLYFVSISIWSMGLGLLAFIKKF